MQKFSLSLESFLGQTVDAVSAMKKRTARFHEARSGQFLISGLVGIVHEQIALLLYMQAE
jgi:hypothetical protein